jgi:hypothetical protein
VHRPRHDDRLAGSAKRQERGQVAGGAPIDQEDGVPGTPQGSRQALGRNQRIVLQMRIEGTAIMRDVQRERALTEGSHELRGCTASLLVPRRREGNHALIDVG